MTRSAPLTFPCRCGETLYLWISADGRQGVRAQHGENREHCIDLTSEGLPDDAVVVTHNRVFARYPARGDPWIVDVGGWWIKAVHDRQGHRTGDALVTPWTEAAEAMDELAETLAEALQTP